MEGAGVSERLMGKGQRQIDISDCLEETKPETGTLIKRLLKIHNSDFCRLKNITLKKQIFLLLF